MTSSQPRSAPTDLTPRSTTHPTGRAHGPKPRQTLTTDPAARDDRRVDGGFAGPVCIGVEGYRVLVATRPPELVADYCAQAELASDLGGPPDPDAGYLFVAVGDGRPWPQLVIVQRFAPAVAGFRPGLLLVPETGQLFIGAGTRLAGYDRRAGRWRRACPTPARSGEADAQGEVPEPEIEYSAAGAMDDVGQQDDGQDHDDQPEEEQDHAGDRISGHVSRSRHGYQLPTAGSAHAAGRASCRRVDRYHGKTARMAAEMGSRSVTRWSSSVGLRAL